MTAGNTVRLNLRFEDFQLNTLGDGRDYFASRDVDRLKRAVADRHPVCRMGNRIFRVAGMGRKLWTLEIPNLNRGQRQ